MAVCSCGSASQVLVRSYEKGYWGDWENAQGPNGTRRFAVKGSPTDFTFYDSSVHPSNYCFRLVIDFGPVLSNQERQKWYTYKGTIYFDKYRKWRDFSRYDVEKVSCHFYDEQTKRVNINVMIERSGRYIYEITADNVGFAITLPWQRAR